MTATRRSVEPSHGTFSTSASLSYFFLQPQTVKFGAVVMDMDRMQNSAECKSNCWNNWSEFNQQSGAMMSALEHVIPEQLFSTIENPAEAISAVKAISIANAQGQKIYTLTSDNFSSVNSQITYHSDDMKNEIISAINEGKTVTVHEAPLSYSGWSGMGYIIIDSEIGAGAYKISSGANGGILAAGLGILSLGLIGIISTLAGSAVAPILIAIALSIAFHIILIELLFNPHATWDSVKTQAYYMLGTVIGILGAAVNIALVGFAAFVAGTVLGLVSLLDA